MKRLRPIHLLWFLSLLFCIVLVSNITGWLRGDVPWLPEEAKWVWPYEQPRWAWIFPCILGIAVYIIGAVRLLNRTKTVGSRYPLHLILWTFVGASLLPLLLMTLEGEPLFLLFTRSASRLTGGFQYALVSTENMDETLRNWPDFVREYRATSFDASGVSLSPPGLLVVYYAFERLFEIFPSLGNLFGNTVRPLECQNLAMMTWSNAELASAWFQMFMPLWAALGVSPLYKLGTMLYDRERAHLAVVLWPLIPGLSIFLPRFNVFYATMTLVMLLVLWRGLLHNHPRQIALSGFVVSMAVFFNLSLIPLGLLGGLIIVGYRLSTRPLSFRPVIRDLLLFGIGSASVWLLYWLLTGLSPMTIIRTGMKYHYELYRPYFPWLFLHTYDTFLFVGLPLTFLVIWRMGRLRRRWSGRIAFAPGDLMTGATALTLIIMVLSGTARGETGRVWLFFAPLWILLGVDVLSEFNQRDRASFMIAQALCVLCMAAVLRANFTALTMPASPAKASQPPTFPYYTQFERGEDRVTLIGVSVETSPTQVNLHLHWRADSRVQRPYVLSLAVVAPDGSSRPGLNWNPEVWEYPPSCWRPGHEFVDTVQIPLDDPPFPGDWLFSLSISDIYTHQPMVIASLGGEKESQVGIGPVHISVP